MWTWVAQSARASKCVCVCVCVHRTEQEGKLLQLEAEIAAANAVTPADVQRMEAEVQMLHARIAEAEAVANAKGSQVRASCTPKQLQHKSFCAALHASQGPQRMSTA